MSEKYGYRFGRVCTHHRSLLNGRDRELYDEIFETLNLYPRKNGFTAYDDVSDNKLGFILTGVLNDHPLLFWVEHRLSTVRIGNNVKITFYANGLYDCRREIEQKLEVECDKIRRKLGDRFEDDYSVSLAIHDYLVGNTVYMDTGDMGHCAAGPILDGKGVCEGISEAYSLLMNSFGVRCTKINGRVAGSDEGHSWNISGIDGHTYHTDVTSDLSGHHRYFNCNNEIMSLTHIFKQFIECDSLEANYYRRNGVLFYSFDAVKSYVANMSLSGKFEFMTKEPSDPDTVLKLFCNIKKGRKTKCLCSEDCRAFMINIY